MTSREMTRQVYDLSVDGKFRINSEEHKCSYNFFKSYVIDKLRHEPYGRIIMQILLPDGWWDLYIYQHGKYEFDYYIPETREQEENHRKYIQ